MSRSFDDYQREKREREWSDKVKKQKEGMGNAERLKRATEWKAIGNEKVKAGNLFEAKTYYREAIVYVEDLVEARRKERNDLLVPLYTNLAHVHLRLEEPALAEIVCTKALDIAIVARNGIPSSLRAKAQFRRALARRALGNLEDAHEDLVAAKKLQPDNDDIAEELAKVNQVLVEKPSVPRAVPSGFLNRASCRERSTERKLALDMEKQKLAEEKRRERRARAEERQQMRDAFEKLSKGKMLYEEREKEMEPVRAKEKEKEKALELECDLLNIIDDSKGLPRSKGMEEFMKKKEEQAKEQCAEMNQKKKILEKVKKEDQWEYDDAWREQRAAHRLQLEQRRAAGGGSQCPKTMWESVEVARWCEQRIRDRILGVVVEGDDELDPDITRKAFAPCDSATSGVGYVLKAIVTDVLNLDGEAAVLRLNAGKPPLFYYDYFVKLEWEITIARKNERSYRSADELISVAAKSGDYKAPPSVTENQLMAGTFKILEFCSEEEPAEGKPWTLVTKTRRPCDRVPELAAPCEELCLRLRDKCDLTLKRWTQEYREYWS